MWTFQLSIDILLFMLLLEEYFVLISYLSKYTVSFSYLNLLLQVNSDDSHSPSGNWSGSEGIPWKNFSRGGSGLGKDDYVMGKMSGKNTSGKQGEKSEPVRKSKRIPKRRILDGEFGDDDDDEDEEIRYLEKLKTSKVSAVYRDDEEVSKKHRKLSSVSNTEASSRLVKNGRNKSRSDKIYEDTDYDEDEESRSEGEPEVKKKRKQKKESIEALMDGKREMTLTTRQRALQSSKDALESGASVIEFPNGLPPAPPKSEHLSCLCFVLLVSCWCPLSRSFMYVAIS